MSRSGKAVLLQQSAQKQLAQLPQQGVGAVLASEGLPLAQSTLLVTQQAQPLLGILALTCSRGGKWVVAG